MKSIKKPEKTEQVYFTVVYIEVWHIFRHH
jgi:hypothetical protein